MKKLLLISNSVAYQQGYLGHCIKEIKHFLGPIKEILFVPYASHDYDSYKQVVRDKFKEIDVSVKSIHENNPVEAVKKADAIFIGGGNTFRLLDKMYETNILSIIKKRVESGELLYIGSSAGANVACPTIKTTNDMPIVQPHSFEALDLIPFQINSHYLDPDPSSKHMGETRETRIKEFHEENTIPVLGIRESSWLIVRGDTIVLEGTTGAKLFKKGKEPAEVKNGEIQI